MAIRYSQARSELRPSKPPEPAPGAQQGVLERVVGIVHRGEHPVAVRVQLSAVGADAAFELFLGDSGHSVRLVGRGYSEPCNREGVSWESECCGSRHRA